MRTILPWHITTGKPAFVSYLLVNCGDIYGVTRWHVSSSKVSDIG